MKLIYKNVLQLWILGQVSPLPVKLIIFDCFCFLQSLVTPLGFIFWTLFTESPFKWHPEGHVSTWFSIGALALMVPAIFVYNMG